MSRPRHPIRPRPCPSVSPAFPDSEVNLFADGGQDNGKNSAVTGTEAEAETGTKTGPTALQFSTSWFLRRMANGVPRYFASLLCVSCAPSQHPRYPAPPPSYCAPKRVLGILFIFFVRRTPKAKWRMWHGRTGAVTVAASRAVGVVRWGPSYHTIKIYEPCACASSQPLCFLADRGACQGKEVKVWHKFYMCHSLTCFLCCTSPIVSAEEAGNAASLFGIMMQHAA